MDQRLHQAIDTLPRERATLLRSLLVRNREWKTRPFFAVIDDRIDLAFTLPAGVDFFTIPCVNGDLEAIMMSLGRAFSRNRAAMRATLEDLALFCTSPTT